MELSGASKDLVLTYEGNYKNRKLSGARIFVIGNDDREQFASKATGINHIIKAMIEDTKYNLILVSQQGALVLYEFYKEQKRIASRIDFSSGYGNTHKVTEKILKSYKEPIPQTARRL